MKKMIPFFIASIIFFMSCVSTKAKSAQIDTHPPSPYDEEGNSIIELVDNDKIQMPLWYWLKIIEHEIDVQANKDLLSADD